MPLDLIELTITRNKIEALVKQQSKELKKFPRKANGLTPDEIKYSPKYRDLKKAYNHNFDQLRKVNAAIVKLRKQA